MGISSVLPFSSLFLPRPNPMHGCNGDCRKGHRPSFDEAAPAEQANALYERYVEALRAGDWLSRRGSARR